jgi:DNA-binding CsgD family transcriptional regulator
MRPTRHDKGNVRRSVDLEVASLRVRRDQALTLRQLEVLRLIVDGKSDREIASGLGLSPNTVSVHRSNIMKTIGVHKTVQLVVYAIREGLVDNLG